MIDSVDVPFIVHFFQGVCRHCAKHCVDIVPLTQGIKNILYLKWHAMKLLERERERILSYGEVRVWEIDADL